LGSIGLVRIVATHAIGRSKRLILMCFLQVGALYVMAIHTQGRWRFGQMKIKLDLAYLTGLMRDVAGVASHIEGRMAAAFVGHVHPGLVAAKAKVFLLVSGCRLQQLKLVFGRVRIVTGKAVARRRGMNLTFDVCWILIGVASETKSIRSSRDQLEMGCVSNRANLVATGAAHRDS